MSTRASARSAAAILCSSALLFGGRAAAEEDPAEEPTAPAPEVSPSPGGEERPEGEGPEAAVAAGDAGTPGAGAPGFPGPVAPAGGDTVAPGAPALPGPASPLAAVLPSGQDAEAAERLQDRLGELDDRVNELMTVPETPASAMLDVGSDAIARPAEVREAAAHLLSAFTVDGRIRPGVAIELAPVRLLRRDAYARRAWPGAHEAAASSYGERLGESLRLSVATAMDVTGAEESQDTLVAFGLRVSLIDTMDYRYNTAAIGRVRTLLASAFPRQVTPGGGDDPHAFTSVDPAELDAELDRALAEAYDAMRVGHRLELAFAGVLSAGALADAADEVELRSLRAWLAYEWGAARSFSLDLALQYEWLREPDVETEDSIEGHRARLGLRANVEGTNARWHVVLSGGLRHVPDAEDDETTGGVEFGTSGEITVSEGVLIGGGLLATWWSGDGWGTTVTASVRWGNHEAPLQWAREYGAARARE